VAFEQYESAEYLEKNPSWGAEDSPFKANQVVAMLRDHPIDLKRVAEVGCGAGEILRQLHDRLGAGVDYLGLDVSPQAIELAQPRATSRLSFRVGDIRDEPDDSFDLMLVMDVIEHVQDYFDLLETVKRKTQYTILHIPLDLSALSVLRPHSLVASHNTLGHVHFFVKETALMALADLGFEVTDWRYTTVFDMTHRPPGSRKLRLLNGCRRAVASLSPDLSAGLLGGYSLLVLAR
jgi:SAM-dependent methyltransferase